MGAQTRMAFTYNLTTDSGKVRLLIPDRVEAAAIFDDDEIAAFLLIEGGVKGAVALAIEAIASDEALVQKVTETAGLKTDGAKTATALLARAKLLREQVTAEQVTADDGEGLFDIAEMVVDPFSARERLWHEALRSG